MLVRMMRGYTLWNREIGGIFNLPNGCEYVSRRTFSGREVVRALRKHRYKPVGRTGSHVRLAYKHPKTGEVRRVTVPMHDELATGTLRNIARQCDADDFDRFCNWIENSL